MAPREFDLNRLPAEWDINDGIDLGDSLGDQDGPAHELDCDTVRDDGEPDGNGLRVHNQGHDDSCDPPSRGYTPARAYGSNGKKKRAYYTDDLKIAIYLELLAKTDPPVLRHGVSHMVAEKFGVPRRLVHNVWRKGQDHGINGVKNQKKRGRKRVEIDFEAIKDLPPTECTTFEKLANALGVKKSTLHKRFKEGYFVRTFQGGFVR